MPWLALITGLIKLAGVITDYAKQNQLLGAGHDQAIAEAATAILAKVSKADAAAERVLHPRDADDVTAAAELRKRFERPG